MTDISFFKKKPIFFRNKPSKSISKKGFLDIFGELHEHKATEGSNTASGSPLLASKNSKQKSLNSKIKNLEEQLKLLTSYSADTIYRLDYKTMKYNYISPNIRELLGFSAEEITKINFRSLILETRIISNGITEVSSFSELESRRKNGDVGKWQADYLMRTKKGDKIWVSDVSHPWFNERGDIIGSIGSLRNITERVNAGKNLDNKSSEADYLAAHDLLDNIYQAKQFLVILNREIKRSKRSDNALSLIKFQIDETNFSVDFNQILGTIKETLRDTLRETDVISFNSEDKSFTVMLPETDKKGGYWVADKLKEKFLQKSMQLASGDYVAIEIFAAVAEFDNHIITDTNSLLNQLEKGIELSKKKAGDIYIHQGKPEESASFLH